MLSTIYPSIAITDATFVPNSNMDYLCFNRGLYTGVKGEKQILCRECGHALFFCTTLLQTTLPLFRLRDIGHTIPPIHFLCISISISETKHPTFHYHRTQNPKWYPESRRKYSKEGSNIIKRHSIISELLQNEICQPANHSPVSASYGSMSQMG